MKIPTIHQAVQHRVSTNTDIVFVLSQSVFPGCSHGGGAGKPWYGQFGQRLTLDVATSMAVSCLRWFMKGFPEIHGSQFNMDWKHSACTRPWCSKECKGCCTLSYLFLPVNLCAAWKYLQGKQVEDEEFSLHGVQQIEGVRSGYQFFELPSTLLHLSFSGRFNKNLNDVIFPTGLQGLSLTRSSKLDFWIPNSKLWRSSGKVKPSRSPPTFKLW